MNEKTCKHFNPFFEYLYFPCFLVKYSLCDRMGRNAEVALYLWIAWPQLYEVLPSNSLQRKKTFEKIKWSWYDLEILILILSDIWSKSLPPNDLTMKTFPPYHLQHHALGYIVKKICPEKMEFDLFFWNSEWVGCGVNVKAACLYLRGDASVGMGGVFWRRNMRMKILTVWHNTWIKMLPAWIPQYWLPPMLHPCNSQALEKEPQLFSTTSRFQ